MSIPKPRPVYEDKMNPVIKEFFEKRQKTKKS